MVALRLDVVGQRDRYVEICRATGGLQFLDQLDPGLCEEELAYVPDSLEAACWP